jgi:serine phosphatase RsbU (regulator of sigma subunit)
MHDGIRAYAYEEWHPSCVLAKMNNLVHRVSPTDTFATVFFGVLEISTGRLYHCTAGHPHPVVVGADSTRFLEGGRSPLLGAFGHSTFSEAEEGLSAGDMLVLYTDGITEARAEEGLFGEARLLDTLRKMRHTPTAKMPKRLLAAVVKFAGEQLHDDTVILSVRWTGPPAG